MSLELTLLQLNSTNQDKGIVNILHHQQKKNLFGKFDFCDSEPLFWEIYTYGTKETM